MKCSRLNVGGINAIVCGQTRIEACAVCRAPAGLLCEIGNGRTCDRPVCEQHTYRDGAPNGMGPSTTSSPARASACRFL